MKKAGNRLQEKKKGTRQKRRKQQRTRVHRIVQLEADGRTENKSENGRKRKKVINEQE